MRNLDSKNTILAALRFDMGKLSELVQDQEKDEAETRTHSAERLQSASEKRDEARSEQVRVVAESMCQFGPSLPEARLILHPRHARPCSLSHHPTIAHARAHSQGNKFRLEEVLQTLQLDVRRKRTELVDREERLEQEEKEIATSERQVDCLLHLTPAPLLSLVIPPLSAPVRGPLPRGPPPLLPRPPRQLRESKVQMEAYLTEYDMLFRKTQVRKKEPESLTNLTVTRPTHALANA